MKTHLFSYRYKGSWYVLEIPADDEIEARDRIATIQSSRVEYDGTLEARIPAAVGSWLPRLITWLGNLFRRTDA